MYNSKYFRKHAYKFYYASKHRFYIFRLHIDEATCILYSRGVKEKEFESNITCIILYIL